MGTTTRVRARFSRKCGSLARCKPLDFISSMFLHPPMNFATRFLNCGLTKEPGSPVHQGQTVTKDSPPAAKIELFRSLFRGRTDVYPRRFESRKTGKAGYAPACANEWVRGVCEKPRIKCTDCPNRRFFQIIDEVISWHLSGCDDRGLDFVMGVYSMMQDETCFFL